MVLSIIFIVEKAEYQQYLYIKFMTGKQKNVMCQYFN